MNVITYAIFDNEGRRLAIVQREGPCYAVIVRPGLLDTSTLDRQAAREVAAERQQQLLGALLAGAGSVPVEVTQ